MLRDVAALKETIGGLQEELQLKGEALEGERRAQRAASARSAELEGQVESLRRSKAELQQQCGALQAAVEELARSANPDLSLWRLVTLRPFTSCLFSDLLVWRTPKLTRSQSRPERRCKVKMPAGSLQMFRFVQAVHR